MKTSIVLGLQFGDEGKGKTVNHLATKDSLVVRFSGGPQAGHTVEHNGVRHVFSSFGAGTLKGAAAYWSKYCPFSPEAMLKEMEVLGFTPKLFVDPLCPLIIPHDILANRQGADLKNGTCGHGVGRCIERTENSPHKVFVIDLLNKDILKWKVENIIRNYYWEQDDADQFLKSCEEVLYYITIEQTLQKRLNQYDHLIFEGSQGIMLDMDHGYFPHVTRSNTTSKNALQLIKDHEILTSPTTYYCMRSYLTRHGNGPMPNEGLEFEDKTNVTNPYQGEFRMGYHNSQLLHYAMKVDGIYNHGDKEIIISHLDQTDNQVLVDNRKIPIHDYFSLYDIQTSINNKFSF